MQIITDSALDTLLSPAELAGLNIHILPQWIHFDGKSYRNRVDIEPEKLYRLMAANKSFPTTSLPSPGEAIALFERVLKIEPEVLVISVSSQLSGTIEVFRSVATQFGNASITIYDSHGFSALQGWKVELAARAAKQGWTANRIIQMMIQLGQKAHMIFTLRDLDYLLHSGRINHLKGLIGCALHVKPQIELDYETGKLEQIGLSATFGQSLKQLLNWMTTRIAPGGPIRVQTAHTNEPESSSMLHDLFDQVYDCHWLDSMYVNPVLGALAGPTICGVIAAPLADFPSFD